MEQAAGLLGVHYMTAYRYLRTGRLAGTMVDGRWQIPLGEVERLLLVPATAPRRGRPGRAPAAGALGDRPGAQHRLARCLVAGDEPGAWALFEQARFNGRSPSELYTQLLGPALREIGERWQSGELTVADEHRATAVAGRLIGRLGPSFSRRGRTRGTVVVGAPAGERHELPVAIAADLLRHEGYRVVDLGADVPATSFAEAAAGADRLVAVAVGVTTSSAARAVPAAVRAVRAAAPRAKVLVGGAAVADGDRARRLGADGWSGIDGDGLIEAVRALAAG